MTSQGQSKRGSIAEAFVNIAVGLVVSMIANSIVFPAYGFHVSIADNVGITLIYTAISLVRSYCLRRTFNWIGFGRLASKGQR
jgi:hypothetical protein